MVLLNWAKPILLDGPDFRGQTTFRTDDALTHRPNEVTFENDFDTAPVLIADMQTTDGWNPAALRYDDLTAQSTSLFVEEERSGDAEVDHTTEVAGVLVLEDGLILGA